MVHSEIENADTVERYISNQLTTAERQAFEEHFFACDECFEKLKAAEGFAVGMRDAAERGVLDARSHSQATNPGWFAWALAASAGLASILAALLAWAYLDQMPRLRAELRQATTQLETEQTSRGQTQPAVSPDMAEANVPLVMLEASRADEQPPTVTLNPNDNRLVLWIEPGPSRYRDFRLDVFSSGSHLVTSLDHLVVSRYGALAASLPTKQLPAGDFRVTLTGQDPPPAGLAGEYRLKIRRR